MYLMITEGIAQYAPDSKPCFMPHIAKSLDEAIKMVNTNTEAQKKLEEHVTVDTYDCVKEHISMCDEYFRFYNIIYATYTLNTVSNYLTKRFVIEI